MYSTLILDIAGQIAAITLNRPDKRNAMSAAMIAELQSALDEIERSHARAAILTGTGKALCSGTDLEMLAAIAQQSHTGKQADSRRMASMRPRLCDCPRPLSAAVSGAGLEGG